MTPWMTLWRTRVNIDNIVCPLESKNKNTQVTLRHLVWM